MTEAEMDPETILALLLGHMNRRQLTRMAMLIDEVSKDTGYGAIKIIISDRSVKHLRAEKSY